MTHTQFYVDRMSVRVVLIGGMSGGQGRGRHFFWKAGDNMMGTERGMVSPLLLLTEGILYYIVVRKK